VEIYTIGFTQTNARDFFGRLIEAGVRRVIDVRLNNSSQLAGFAKRDDLAFFVEALCDAEYVHEPRLAPTQELLDGFKKHKGAWNDYEEGFNTLLRERRIEDVLAPEFFAGPSVLLCSEATPEHCHRRLIVDYLQQVWPEVAITPVHL
jgi:uncharacterized protein (DUF488 family)